MISTRLSPRQREIVVLVGRDDLSWKAVARTLGVHLSTVRNHVREICTRAGVEREPRTAMVELYWREVVGIAQVQPDPAEIGD